MPFVRSSVERLAADCWSLPAALAELQDRLFFAGHLRLIGPITLLRHGRFDRLIVGSTGVVRGRRIGRSGVGVASETVA